VETAGEILKDLLRDIGIDGRDEYSSLFQRWSGFVGDSLASHSKVVDIVNGFLVVRMDHPGWYQTFQFQEASILKRIQKQYPELGIRGIKVRIESPGESPGNRDIPAKPPDEELNRLFADLRNDIDGRKRKSRGSDRRSDLTEKG
jgi:predicted nucleic acid-binding Zn ribbon protein